MENQENFQEEEYEKITFGESIKNYFKGYFKFRGFTSRREYWLTQALILPITLIISVLIGMLAVSLVGVLVYQTMYQANAGSSVLPLSILIIILALILLGFFFPSLTMNVRRFRDVGITGIGYIAWTIIAAIPSIFVNNANGYNLDGSTYYSPLWGIYGFIVAVIGIVIVCLPEDKLTTTSDNQYMLWFFRPREDEDYVDEEFVEIDEVVPESEVKSESVSETQSETSSMTESESTTESESITETESQTESESTASESTESQTSEK